MIAQGVPRIPGAVVGTPELTKQKLKKVTWSKSRWNNKMCAH